jgi:hypothetical protein
LIVNERVMTIISTVSVKRTAKVGFLFGINKNECK